MSGSLNKVMDTNTQHIDASPTKEFFISILIRDVALSYAIGDLIDNCVDGARRIRPNSDYSGLYIKVNFGKDSFTIEDNCGGIPYEVAQKYAFRFGRPKDMPSTPGSIGEFGVGMKRALFKMGTQFSISSKTEKTSFTVKVDVEEWKKLNEVVNNVTKERWEFDFSELNLNADNPINSCGTTITVTNLHENISEEFKLENFATRLSEQVRSQQAENLDRGLDIFINKTALEKTQFHLLQSNQLKSLYLEKNYERKEGKIDVKIYAGISEPKLEECGWYVICNSRLVLKADKTRLTGWGDQLSDNDKTPKAHYQFARFRGYVYFNSDSTSLIPWNTTKSSVDAESPIFQATKLEMKPAMRQVIEFLNKLDAELDKGETRLESLIKEAKPTRIRDIPFSAKFTYPKSDNIGKPKTTKITYERSIEDVALAKRILGVTTNKEVGEKTFEYFISSEVEE